MTSAISILLTVVAPQKLKRVRKNNQSVGQGPSFCPLETGQRCLIDNSNDYNRFSFGTSLGDNLGKCIHPKPYFQGTSMRSHF